MRYTVSGIQQSKMLEFNLDPSDALVIRTLIDMYGSPSMEKITEGGKEYIWVNQQYLHRQIPTIGAVKTLARRLNKFEKLGLLEKKLRYKKNGIKGTYSYIFLTQKLYDLQEYEPMDKMSERVGQNVLEGVDKMSKGGRTKCPNKDSLIKDTHINDSIREQPFNYKRVIELYAEHCKELPQVRALTDSRKKTLKAWGNIEEIEEVFKKAGESKFLAGTNDRKWKANFDWIINQTNRVKILEDAYIDKEVKEQPKVPKYRDLGAE